MSKATDFPGSMFAELFAVTRAPCWVAQWNEMTADAVQKFERRQQCNFGQSQRDFVEIEIR